MIEMELKEIEASKIKIGENSRALGEIPLDQLMDSIKKVGLLHPPGIVKKNKHYEVIYGNRRILACQKLGLNYIKCFVLKKVTNQDKLTLNLIENLQRDDLSITEQGRYMVLLQSMGLTNTEIASRLSIPVTKVRTIIHIYKRLPTKYIKKIVQMGPGKPYKKGKIPASIADMILQMDKRHGIGKYNMHLLLNKARDENFGGDEINRIMTLIKEGLSVGDAIKEMDKIQVIRLSIGIKKNEIKRCKEKFNRSIYEIVKEIVYGKRKSMFTAVKTG